MQANRFAGIVTDNSITRANTSILTTGPQGADVGPMIGLGGSRGSATVMFAGVRGAKENGTIDDTRGYLAFYTVDDAGAFAERGRITSGGALGLGTSLPADQLQVVGDIRVGASGTDGCVKRFDGMGLVGTCVSDQRFKRDITSFGPALSSVTALRPVYYFWRAADYPERHFGDTRAYGLIAQEVEKVLPELVVTNPDGYKAVDYSKLPLLTVQAIKELKAENDELKTRSNAMQSRLAEMERVVKQLLTNRSF